MVIFGGGNIGSTAILLKLIKINILLILVLIINYFYLKALSTIGGIIFYNTFEEISKQGLVLISMSQTLKFSSIIKSNPKISIPVSLEF